jgi:hypothetical protein
MTSDRTVLKSGWKEATEYDPKWEQMLVEHLSSGLSFHSFLHKMPCGKTRAYQFLKEQPNFAFAKQIGESRDLEWCEKVLRAHQVGAALEGFDPKRANIAALFFKMKTRYYETYGDVLKHEMNQNQSIKIQIDSDDSGL